MTILAGANITVLFERLAGFRWWQTTPSLARSVFSPAHRKWHFINIECKPLSVPPIASNPVRAVGGECLGPSKCVFGNGRRERGIFSPFSDLCWGGRISQPRSGSWIRSRQFAEKKEHFWITLRLARSPPGVPDRGR